MKRISKGPWSTFSEAPLSARTKRSQSTSASKPASNADASLWTEMSTTLRVLWREVSSRPRIPSCNKQKMCRGFWTKVTRFSKERTSWCNRFRRIISLCLRLRKTWMRLERLRVRFEPISSRYKGWKMGWVLIWSWCLRSSSKVPRRNWRNFRIISRNLKWMKRSLNLSRVPKVRMKRLSSTLLSRLRKERMSMLS